MMIDQDQLSGSVFLQVVNETRHVTLLTHAKIADTLEARRVGLLDRDSLDPGEGLYIRSASRIHTIGMKFPIDVIFISRAGHVIRCFSLDEGRLVACDSARATLELPIGTVSRTGTQPGDHLSFAEVCG
jgi:hypothetical protein